MLLFHRTRRALSLTEVLISIFVMAIGMISLLVLFIVGLQNARAGLDMGRMAMSASTGQADSEAPHVIVTPITNTAPAIVGVSSRSLRNDWVYSPDSILHMWRYIGLNPYLAPFINNRPDFLVHGADPSMGTMGTWTFDERVSPLGTVVVPPGSPIPTVVEPPVLVDPQPAARWYGQPNPTSKFPYQVGANVPNDPLANIPTPLITLGLPSALRPLFSLGIPRATTLPLGFTLRDTLLGTSLPDEVAFGNDGNAGIYPTAIPPTGPRAYTRDNRFAWAYLCRWPNYDTPEICDVTMVAFIGRPDGGGVSQLPPGEVSYISAPQTSLAAGLEIPANNFGRMFIKGSTTAVVRLTTGLPMAAKAGDWILDNTFILPEYDPTNVITINGVSVIATAPFLDRFNPATVVAFPAPGNPLRPGIAGGYFYKITGITDVQVDPVSGFQYQVLTIDRPARSDGFVGTMITGVADVIEKGVGRMPAR
jgi:hypothetical protein